MIEEFDTEIDIKDFFKSNIFFDKNKEILKFNPVTLIGIDKINSDVLARENIKTIEALANLSEVNPPLIKEISQNILIKWIKIAKVLRKAILKEVRGVKKILMVGLDNGGKSSLLGILENHFSILQEIMPTKGVSREKLDFFGYPIISWDLGGQVQFREKLYLEKPELYFSNADLIIYVLDIQDEDRFNETALYLSEILKNLNQMNEYPPFLIVFNKSDPDFAETAKWTYHVELNKEKFKSLFERYKGFKYTYRYTSIYNKETVTSMFSKAFTKISETTEIIEHILHDFRETIQARAISVISMEGLVFASVSLDKDDEERLNNIALLLQTLQNFLKTQKLKIEHTITQDLPENNLTIQGEMLFDYSPLKIPVYVWLLSDKKLAMEGTLDFLRTELNPLIKLFI